MSNWKKNSILFENLERKIKEKRRKFKIKRKQKNKKERRKNIRENRKIKENEKKRIQFTSQASLARVVF